MSTVPGKDVRVFLGLGSNQGDRLEHLRSGLAAIDADPALDVVRSSSVYETEFVGPGRQDPYLNACAEIRCGLTPRKLMAVLQGIERARGRTPDSHMKPRPLDLDILLFGGEILQDPDLVVPHPRARQRAFVLVPLAEIAGGEKFPDSGETVAGACAKIGRKSDGAPAPCPHRSLWPIRSE